MKTDFCNKYTTKDTVKMLDLVIDKRLLEYG